MHHNLLGVPRSAPTFGLVLLVVYRILFSFGWSTVLLLQVFQNRISIYYMLILMINHSNFSSMFSSSPVRWIVCQIPLL